MADQKAMKKRLKLLMQKPENQVCSDCPERQPRWASLIVPPPGSPPGSTAIGAFCCLECSGSHRRLGVHISFVRSINLDSWKEKEVLAMENGGNRKVNAIWEANLARAGGQKPPIGADLNTRERYIRDKYERRKFYDHQALVDYQNSEPSMDDLVSRNRDEDFANFGPPPDEQISDAARLRAEKKKKAAPERSGSFDAPSRSRSGDMGGSGGKRRVKKVAAAPATAPAPEVDLLDLGGGGSPEPATTNTNNNQDFTDFFGADTNGTAEPTHQPPSRQKSSDGSRKGSRSRSKEDGGRTKSKTPERKTKPQLDVMSMYHTPMGGGQGFGAAQSNNNSNNSNMMSMMNQMQNMSMNPQQQQQQQQQRAANDSGGKYNSRFAMHQTMQPQMAQQAFNPQLMQQMFQQNPQMMQQMMQQMGMNPQMMQQMMAMNQSMMQGMPNMQMGMNQNHNMMSGMNNNSNSGMYNNMNNGGNNMTGMNNNNMMNHQHNNQFGGAPMGSGPPISTQNGKANKQAAPEKEDPFAQFGMNAFR